MGKLGLQNFHSITVNSFVFVSSTVDAAAAAVVVVVVDWLLMLVASVMGHILIGNH